MSEDRVYRQLQRHLDKLPVGFPESPTGADIRLLETLFTPEEAQIATELSLLPEPADKIHRRMKNLNLSREELEIKLDRMVLKGLIRGTSESRQKRLGKKYAAVWLAVGMYEYQGGSLTKELEERFSEYLSETFHKAAFNKNTSQMRTIPIDAEITLDKSIEPFDNIREIIRNARGPIAVGPCVCRTGKDLTEKPCSCSDIRDTCLFIGSSADYMMYLGHGRKITKEETLKILDDAEKHGFVIQPQNTRYPGYICCCCPCCCHVLNTVKSFSKPAEYFHSNYRADIDAESCIGCENCLARCPMEALSIADQTCRVERDRCIGCGLCVSVCDQEAIALQRKEKAYDPPANSGDLYQRIMMERFGKIGMLKRLPNMVLGRKV